MRASRLNLPPSPTPSDPFRRAAPPPAHAPCPQHGAQASNGQHVPLLLELLDELLYYYQFDDASAAPGADEGGRISHDLVLAAAAEAIEQIAAVRPTAEPAAVGAMQVHLDATLAYVRERRAACAAQGAEGATAAARYAQLLTALGMPLT